MSDTNRLAIIGLESLVAQLEKRIAALEEQLESLKPKVAPPPPEYDKISDAIKRQKEQKQFQPCRPEDNLPWSPLTPMQPWRRPYPVWVGCTVCNSNVSSATNDNDISDSEFIRKHSIGRKEYKRN